MGKLDELAVDSTAGQAVAELRCESHHRTVVGSDLPFSITGTAAPPFRRSMKMYAAGQLWLARNRTRSRIKRARSAQGAGS